MRILLTGFDPFDGRSINPSWEAVRQLDGEVIAGAWVHAIKAPVVWRESVAASVEALAHAIGDSPWVADNAGLTLSNERSDGDPGGPDALLATAPVRSIAAALNAAGIPA